VLAEVPFRDFGSRDLTDYSYGLGGIMFALLYGRLGPERFDAAYRSLWAATARTGVSFQDLQQAFLRAAPGDRLERFFDECDRRCDVVPSFNCEVDATRAIRRTGCRGGRPSIWSSDGPWAESLAN
jgi:hypothetical protein